MDWIFKYKFLVLVGFVFLGSLRAASVEPIALQAEKLNVESLQKQSVTSELLGEGIYVIDFWATWCASCKASLPVFYALKESYEPRGFHFKAVSIDVDEGALQSYVEEKSLDPASVLRMAPESLEIFGLFSVPSTVIIQNGNLVYVDNKPLKLSEASLRDTLEKITQ